MQQRTKVTIDDNDDDDDDDAKQEVTDTIEKFVQTRHVQTLKYLRHVIDENRHLRLHIEHLKRRQENPVQSPGYVDPIDPEESPLTEIPPGTPEIVFDLEHIDEATNTDGEDFEMKYYALNEEMTNLKKQHSINREEFQRELERVDGQNVQLERDLKLAQQQLIHVQKSMNDKEIEIKHLTSTLSDNKIIYDGLNFRFGKLEQTNRLLTQALTESEQKCAELQANSEELRRIYEQTEKSLLELQLAFKNNQTHLDKSEKHIETLQEKVELQTTQNQELHNDNEELKVTVKFLEQQLQEKILQEEKYMQEMRATQANSNFKEFVQVKRTLQLCQQENEQMRIELKKLQIKLFNKNE